MKTGINIGTNLPKEHVLGAGDAIAQILLAGAESGSDQQTIQAALRALTDTSKVEHVTVSGCSIVQEAPCES